MPKVTRWMIKAGLVYLAAGVILAGMHDILAGLTGVSLLAVYWHMIVMGWVTQVIIGVSIWMFPGRRRGRKREESLLHWMVFALLNTGLVVRFGLEPMLSGTETGMWIQAGVIMSALFQAGAVFVYLAEMWPRLQPKKRRG
ncbi:MAG: hypothetical protein R3283_04040 [Balneolaceae bacterium]|nr:hypothetical protein [Balneolaceae bacterium]